MAQTLSNVNKLERLSPLVYRVLGCNPGAFTLQGTNTYIVGNGKERLLIDTGEPNKAEYTTNLRKVLQDENANISMIICTHWHHDHVGGVPDVLEKVLDKKPLKLHKLCHTNDANIKDIAKFAPHGFEYLGDRQEISVDGATLRVVHTPGHTTDHIALHLLQENAIFSGDCVLGEGTTVFEDLHTYMQSLQVLLALQPTTIYPGHGPVVSEPVAKVSEYIAHRNQREAQILQCLSAKPNSTIVAIVQHVYPDLPLTLKLGAGNNVRHHLNKLIKDEKVVETNNLLMNTFELAKPKL